MNVKKFLKTNAQKDLQSVQTESDREVLQRLENSVAAKTPKQRHRLKWLSAMLTAALACSVATVLLVEFVPHAVSDKYEEANCMQEDSDLSELSNALTDLTLRFTEDQSVNVMKFYDSLSGDELYYVLTIDVSSMEAVYSMRFLIVVNDRYHYDKLQLDGDIKTATYTDYTVTYTHRVNGNSDFGVNLVECSAEIVSAKYMMYVLMYQEYSLGNGMFLTVIDEMLDFHA